MQTLKKYNKIEMRSTKPGLYYTIMLLALTNIALGFNFFYSHPTFNPFDIPKQVVGIVFLLTGLSQFVALNWLHNPRLVRAVVAIAMVVCFAWGLINTQSFFLGKTSLQLPILYICLTLIRVPILFDIPVYKNPNDGLLMTEKKFKSLPQ